MGALAYGRDEAEHMHHRHHHHDQQQGNSFTQTNLVSSDTSVPAEFTDPNLINPWGVSHGPGGPLWVSDNGTGVTTIYDGAGALVPIAGHPAITVAAPPGQDPSAPTGQVF